MKIIYSVSHIEDICQPIEKGCRGSGPGKESWLLKSTLFKPVRSKNAKTFNRLSTLLRNLLKKFSRKFLFTYLFSNDIDCSNIFDYPY